MPCRVDCPPSERSADYIFGRPALLSSGVAQVFTLQAAPRCRGIPGVTDAGALFSPMLESAGRGNTAACVGACRLRSRHPTTSGRPLGRQPAQVSAPRDHHTAERRGTSGSARRAGADPISIRAESGTGAVRRRVSPAGWKPARGVRRAGRQLLDPGACPGPRDRAGRSALAESASRCLGRAGRGVHGRAGANGSSSGAAGGHGASRDAGELPERVT